ncbi:hypothetical protein LCGC14_2594730 [marine sediment metagenome]|uniref:Uncharacterized protein n=1 Tax=marine sediment metagenome TaxID=412755 RepID=A0A0F9D379_9ZZZZ
MFKSKNDAQSKELTVQSRAIAALGLENLKKELTELAGKSKSLTGITNEDGYKQVHAARMVLKNERIDISKKAKAARDDANEFSKEVIAEEKRLIGIISPEEDRLQALQTEHDERAERERQAKIETEAKRVEDIQERIAAIRGAVEAVIHLNYPSAKITELIDDIETIDIDDSFAEFQDQAEDTKVATLAKLREAHSATVERDAETAKIAAERAELEELRAAAEKRAAQEQFDLAAAEAKAKKKREAEAKKQREELEEQHKKQAAAQKKIDDENARLAEERADLEREQRKEADRKAAEEKAEQDRKDAAQAAAKNAKYPGEQAIVDALTEHFGVPSEVVMAWLTELRKVA